MLIHNGAVLAKSFARIFYRNAINIGLLAIECDTDAIDDGDELELDIEKGVITDLTNGAIIQIEPLPAVMIKLLKDGGLVEHIKKNGDFKLTDYLHFLCHYLYNMLKLSLNYNNLK